MLVVHESEVPRRGPSDHRGGGIMLRSLLRGTEGTPENFDLMLIDAEGFSTPQHRHNFDQVRILLDGEFGFGAGLVQKSGTVAYFPEGTYYIQNAPRRSLTLLLQAGGASGGGYMSARQLAEGVDSAKQRGRFEGGVFTWEDENGKKHNKDGYEAAWEAVHGRTIAYPKPQYEAPVIVHEERIGWRSVPGQAGVHQKLFGVFAGSELRVSRIRVEAGQQWQQTADTRDRLLYVVSGAGEINGHPLRAGSAVHIAAAESALLRAEPELECYWFQLTVFAGQGHD